MTRRRCSPSRHTDRLLRGGRRVRCDTCGDEFPCRHACEHTDCRWEREEPGLVIGLELGFDVPVLRAAPETAPATPPLSEPSE